MATIPTMRTWVTGEVVTAAEMNSNIRDAGNFLLGGAASRRPTLFAGLTANQTITSGVNTVVAFNSAGIDTDSGLNTSTGVYTVATAGLWLFTGMMFWTGNGTGYRSIAIFVSGGEAAAMFLNATPDPGSSGRSPIVNIGSRAVGNTCDMRVTQTSGGNLALLSAETYMAAVWLTA